MAAVCDNTGSIKWFETDDLNVIKIDGHDVCSLIEETKEEHNKDKVPSYCPACGTSIFEDNKVCGSCGITLIIDDENLPKLY